MVRRCDEGKDSDPSKRSVVGGVVLAPPRFPVYFLARRLKMLLLSPRATVQQYRLAIRISRWWLIQKKTTSHVTVIFMSLTSSHCMGTHRKEVGCIEPASDRSSRVTNYLNMIPHLCRTQLSTILVATRTTATGAPIAWDRPHRRIRPVGDDEVLHSDGWSTREMCRNAMVG